MVKIERGVTDILDIRRNPETEDKHQERRTQKRKDQPNRIAEDLHHFVACIREHPSEPQLPRRDRGQSFLRRVGNGKIRGRLFFCLVPRRGTGNRVLHVSDEGIFQIGGSAHFDQFFRRVARKNFPGIHKRDPVAVHSFIHKMRRDKDSHSLTSGKLDQKLPKAVPGDRIDAGSRLIKDQDLRLVQNRHGKGKPLFQSHRKRIRRGIKVRAQTELLDKFPNAGLRFRCRDMVKARVQNKVLANGQFPVEGKRLGHVTEIFSDLHAPGLHRTPEKHRGPVRRGQKSCQHLHGRGFAASV
ncbi:MAG: hypothetical protein BWY42_01660 [Candidatus Omnitrophica bacterium ADurb.Bin277]|nr:MAG: hypothetical protein BWY42_01660 [Candidatus Omnitrophica bacterium ADurb.Bin277]